MIVNPDTFTPAMGSLVGASPCPADQKIPWVWIDEIDPPLVTVADIDNHFKQEFRSASEKRERNYCSLLFRDGRK